MLSAFRHLFCLHRDYQISAEPGVIFLRCRTCGRRTTGWLLHPASEEEAALPRSDLKMRPRSHLVKPLISDRAS